MKQILQSARSGEVFISEVPAPVVQSGCILVRVAASVVSSGTERAMAQFAGKNLLRKSLARPDLFRDAVGKARREGVLSTLAAVRARLDKPSSLGYSSAGVVVAVGSGVPDFSVGDSVACAGAGLAVHAEFANVPRLLAAKIPAGSSVTFEEAAFSTLGAVALHGVRLSEAKLGDVVAVIGLGLLGQLTVQILKAAGCTVVGLDLAADRASLALAAGADAAFSGQVDFVSACSRFSQGQGVDAVLIAAETPDSSPVNLAADVARDRAVVVSVGTVGLDLQRKKFFEKELVFRVSRSYGPGRYDPDYELRGNDYPIGYVRWTENRNMEAFLRMLADGKLSLSPLITHRFPVARAEEAYSLIASGAAQNFLGVVIAYPNAGAPVSFIRLSPSNPPSRPDAARVGLIGSGIFANGVLLPAIAKTGAVLVGACSATGANAQHAARKFGFSYSTTDWARIVDDRDINTVFVATRHNLHAGIVIAALKAGKHVFCEKPLCVNEGELADIARAYDEKSGPNHPRLMVGFNRRFAPLVALLRSHFQNIDAPLALHYRVNAGSLPLNHWTNDPAEGGRIIGEACHFIDLAMFLIGGVPVSVRSRKVGSPDSAVISVEFANQSQVTISYLANGDRNFPKERLEIFGGGAVGVLDDFRRLDLVRGGKNKSFRSRLRQDKGHAAACAAFLNSIESGAPSPISFEEVFRSTLVTLRAAEAVQTRSELPLQWSRTEISRTSELSEASMESIASAGRVNAC